MDDFYFKYSLQLLFKVTFKAKLLFLKLSCFSGLTLSLLARQLIPPLNIAYAAFCSSVIYVIFGSCHQMSIGEFSTEIHMRWMKFPS